MNIYHRPPSKDALAALAALQSAVTKALDKKQKLGHYAVFWKNGEVTLAHFDGSSNETGIDNEVGQLSSDQQSLLDSPEMTNEECLGIEEKRK